MAPLPASQPASALSPVWAAAPGDDSAFEVEVTCEADTAALLEQLRAALAGGGRWLVSVRRG